MDVATIGLLIAGLVVLVIGAEVLVRGAARLAEMVGISSLVIGLTVVAFGTSSPELAVSLRAALAGQPDIALGNVVGSNIFNVLFILGICALILPLSISMQLVRLDVPLMIGASVLLLLLALDGQIGLLDGLLLFTGILAYTTFAIVQGRKEEQARRAAAGTSEDDRVKPTFTTIATALGMALLGLVLLVVGAGWLVDSAIAIARVFGISELVIGLTIVAAGTSLPELATSIVASIKGERDIAVGNVVGSNLFNILSILGLTSIIAPITVAPVALRFDIPVMLAVAVACLPIFFTGMRIARWEGALFLVYYIAYTLFLVLSALGHTALPWFGSVMMFVLPLTGITLAILGLRALRHNPTPHLEQTP